ncbi:uncharacterized protein LOC119074969 [Bradysia coprophila]|uniref:uncharacterized protein LOC119074969 n=1 Tax=Bradysia coprophila TaxID=38358 RepID=UPI00187D80BE|nr:uncharacterized protein LOC119074969 [Bradysia coprophila]
MDVIPPRHRKQRNSNFKTTETGVVHQENEQFSKRELLSNWNKYDDNVPQTDAPLASNFEELLSQPASVGGHFLFNSEKGWESNDDWYNRDDYFQLNLIELSKSLATLPYYERLSYSQSIFSSEEIDEMNRQAKYQLFKWQSKGSNTGSSRDVKCEANVHNIDHVPQNDDDDLEELLKITGTGHRKMKISEYSSNINQSTGSSVTIQSVQARSTAESTDDIQKWLDDVLILDS